MDKKPDLAHVDVRYVADLARIALSEEEERQFSAELDDILEYVGQLDELDVSGIEPTAHAAARANVMRDDEPRPVLDRDLLIANAPSTIDAMYVAVPAVIEEEH